MTAATGESVCPKRCASDLVIGWRVAVSRRLGPRLRAQRRGAQSPSHVGRDEPKCIISFQLLVAEQIV